MTLSHSPISTQKNNLIFWIMKQPKRSQWLIGGSVTDSLRPSQTNKQTQKWWETETPCSVPYSDRAGRSCFALSSLYSVLLFGNQSGLQKLFIPLVMGREWWYPHHKRAKGKKKCCFRWVKGKTSGCYLDVIPRERTEDSGSMQGRSIQQKGHLAIKGF